MSPTLNRSTGRDDASWNVHPVAVGRWQAGVTDDLAAPSETCEPLLAELDTNASPPRQFLDQIQELPCDQAANQTLVADLPNARQAVAPPPERYQGFAAGDTPRSLSEREDLLSGYSCRPRQQEQYRQLWEQVVASRQGEAPRLLIVGRCGPEPHTGELLGRLAVMLARDLGHSVVLVDGDLVDRTVTRQCGLGSVSGLSDALASGAARADQLHRTALERLWLLPAGAAPFPPAASLTLTLEAISQTWRQQADFVLIDGGDARQDFFRALHGVCDASYLLVRLGKTPRELAEVTLEELEDRGVVLSGCWVSNVPQNDRQGACDGEPRPQ